LVSTQLAAAKVSKPDFAQISGSSNDISKPFFEMGICKFEPFKVSQAITQLEIVRP